VEGRALSRPAKSGTPRRAPLQSENGVVTQFFRDAEQLIVFRDAIGAAERAGFDLAGVGRDRNVGNGCVFGLAGTMTDNDGVIVLLREVDGGEAAVRAFLDGLRYITLAESLGGVESLIAHPATMTHAAMSVEARAAAGIGDGLLRLSVGIEALDDLRSDIETALERAAPAITNVERKRVDA